MLLFRFVFFVVLLAGHCLGYAAHLLDVRTSHNQEKTRVVLTFDEAVHYDLFTLINPERVVIDIQQANIRYDFSSLKQDNTPIVKIRSAAKDQNVHRLVLDLKSEHEVKHFILAANEQYGPRLVIDLFPLASTPAMVTPTVLVPVAKAERTGPLREVVVVIDPGHGGKDPGAVGPKGTLEKNITLAVSRELQQMLNKQPGMKAVLTRDRDVFIPLRDRLRIAREHKADLFISVHADAFKDPRANGASVFALSQRGATSEAAKWLAEKENYSELAGVALSELEDHMVRSVLIDLSQTATIAASLDVGDEVLSQMGGMARLHSKRVEQAGFVVLKSPDIPSILVETGFISNPKEEANLGSKAYRQRIAQAIQVGVNAYFWRQPPEGSYLAAWREAKTYKVVSGDSLSVIAEKHRVSLAALKQVNQLDSDVIRVGQTLRIPMTT